MDASIAIKPVFDRFQSVVITSGVCLATTLYLFLQYQYICIASVVVTNLGSLGLLFILTVATILSITYRRYHL